MIKHKSMNSFLFVTDLDNTLVGDDIALNQLNQQLVRQREQSEIKIVYATGRSLYLYRLLAGEKGLLPPDALITSVGTEMYFDFNSEVFDAEWAEILSEGWDRDRIEETARNYPELQLQPKSEQNPFKISYYLAQSVAETILTRLRADLKGQGYKVKLIYSAGQDLDLLPQNGDKGLALRFLRNKWNIAADRTIVCGDSGNDIALLQGEEKGIIVANAKRELLQWYEANQNETLYLAEAGYAAGILEGLKYFNFV